MLGFSLDHTGSMQQRTDIIARPRHETAKVLRTESCM
jgi:hypothetical protein